MFLIGTENWRAGGNQISSGPLQWGVSAWTAPPTGRLFSKRIGENPRHAKGGWIGTARVARRVGLRWEKGRVSRAGAANVGEGVGAWRKRAWRKVISGPNDRDGSTLARELPSNFPRPNGPPQPSSLPAPPNAKRLGVRSTSTALNPARTATANDRVVRVGGRSKAPEDGRTL